MKASPKCPPAVLAVLWFALLVGLPASEAAKASEWQRADTPLLQNFNNMYNPCVVEVRGEWRYRMWFFGGAARHANEGMGWGATRSSTPGPAI
jgi:hypothetical protein